VPLVRGSSRRPFRNFRPRRVRNGKISTAGDVPRHRNPEHTEHSAGRPRDRRIRPPAPSSAVTTTSKNDRRPCRNYRFENNGVGNFLGSLRCRWDPRRHGGVGGQASECSPPPVEIYAAVCRKSGSLTNRRSKYSHGMSAVLPGRVIHGGWAPTDDDVWHYSPRTRTPSLHSHHITSGSGSVLRNWITRQSLERTRR
jgi:hypothetical protein